MQSSAVVFDPAIACRPHRARRSPPAAGALVIAACALFAWADGAHAELYRCEAAGAISYSDRPCATGSQRAVVSRATYAAARQTAGRQRAHAAEGNASRRTAAADDCPQAVEVVHVVTLGAASIATADVTSGTTAAR